jgi:hypothetical protein
MRFRKLRIAWSVAWGLAALLLIVLWVRSYWWIDFVTVPNPMAAQISSGRGTIRFPRQNVPTPSWRFVTISMVEVAAELKAQGEEPPVSPRPPLLYFDIKPSYVALSYLYPLVVFGAITGIPWIGNRFSLRTLLIATTLVAVVLGLIVWLR